MRSVHRIKRACRHGPSQQLYHSCAEQQSATVLPTTAAQRACGCHAPGCYVAIAIANLPSTPAETSCACISGERSLLSPLAWTQHAVVRQFATVVSACSSMPETVVWY